MNKMRRTLCQSMGGVLGLLSLNACSQPGPKQAARVYTEEEQQRLYKFRGVKGYDLTVELFPKRQVSSRGLYCKIVDHLGNYFAGGIGIHTGEAGLPPLTITAALFDDTNANWKDKPPELIGQWTVPVADRIPDALLDDLRRDPRGGLRIKIRLHREGVLLGWDIQHRPGFDPKRAQEGQYYPPAYSHTGGDFKEARLAHYIESRSSCRECVAAALAYRRNPSVVYTDEPNGFTTLPMGPEFGGNLPKPLADHGYYLTPQINAMSPRRLRENGWYIHPKTGQRIETDF